MRLFYIDDSGSVSSGFVVYSWVECLIEDWRDNLRRWLDLRKDFYAQYRIPPSYELHMSKFLNGHGFPSADPSWNGSKKLRGEVVQEALRTIGACPNLGVGTVYRRSAATGKAYSIERDDVYDKLVRHLDARLAAHGEFGLLFMDGDGSVPGYHAAHRRLKLVHRHVIEDPLFQHSDRTLWVQMADLTAYVTYQSLLRAPQKQFGWDWYRTYLAGIDVNHGPLVV